MQRHGSGSLLSQKNKSAQSTPNSYFFIINSMLFFRGSDLLVNLGG